MSTKCVTFTAYILLSLQVSVATCSWFRGCYLINNGSKEALEEEETRSLGTRQEVGASQCIHSCREKGYGLAAVKCSRECNCLDDVEGWTRLAAEDCSKRSSKNSSSCEQRDGIWHLYSLDGPHLEDVNAKVDSDLVIVEIPVALDVSVKLSEFVNITQDYLNHTWPQEVLITWDFGSQSKNVTLLTDTSTLYGRVQHVFTRAGTHNIGLTVTNDVSSINTTLTVTVLGPAPYDLQVTHYVEPSIQPSCLPSDYEDAIPEGQYFTVFEDHPFILEASVSAGHDLTFTYDVKSPSGQRHTVLQDKAEDSCEGRACYLSQQELYLEKRGVYSITVTVKNQHGSLDKIVTVIVIEWKISNLSFSLMPGGVSIITPDHLMKFYTQVEITSRLNATLQVDFDDGHVHVAELEDTNSTSMALNCNQGEMYVSSSYGKGCTLNVEFEHSYVNEGVYRPNARVFKGETVLTTNLTTSIRVMNTVLGARLQSARAVAVNQSADFLVHLSASSKYMNVTWVTMDSERNVLSTYTTKSVTMSKTFINPGLYMITAVVENRVSRVSATSNLLVQVPIMGAYVSCGSLKYVSTGEELECTADIFDGSNPKFVWRFEKGQQFVPTVNRNLSSVARYSFDSAGSYNVSVRVYNDISMIVAHSESTIFVVNPITCVAIVVCCPTKYKDMALFKVTFCQGSNVQLQFDFGQGRQDHVYEYDNSEGAFFLGYTFKSTGIHDVTVFAYNAVSEVFHTTQVLVQEDVTDLKIEVFEERALVNVPVILIVKSRGAVFRREDLVYRWEFSDGEHIVSASPVIGKLFATTGSHNVNFTAANVVGSFHTQIPIVVRARQDEELILANDVITKYGESVQFSVKGIDVHLQELRISYGDGDSEEIDLHDTISTHRFAKPGLYSVQATAIDTGANVQHLNSIVLVEEIITGLQLLGPQIVEIESLQKDYMWQASVATGTNIIYHWVMGDKHRNNTINKFIRGFPEPGIFELIVTCVNDLSHQEANVTVTVQYPIVDIIVTIPPSILGRDTNVNVTVVGGREFVVDIDFGDGTKLVTSSKDLPDSAILTLQPAGNGMVPKYLIHFTHSYEKIQTYTVGVNVSNLISAVNKTHKSVIHEPIGDIVLETTSPAIVSIVDPVVVKVTVGSGQNLTYEWDFSNIFSPTSISSDGNMSIATHTFGFQGVYEVSVRVGNPYYPVPVQARLPFQFVAVEEIQNVYLEVVDGRTGASLEGVFPNQITDEITFKASCLEGSDVEFLFDFDDGVTTVTPGVENMFPVYVKGYAVHKFKHEGVFNISVTARNPLGNITAVLESPFYVQAPSFDLRLDQTRYYTRLGNATILRVNFTVGTNVTFDWKLGDQSDIINDGGPMVNHTYKAHGVYTVVVIARNKVSNETATAIVHVETEIQGIDLNVSSYLVAASDKVKFTALTFPHSSTVSYYVWNFGETGEEKIGSTAAETYTYSKSGKFIATVKAYNNISHIESEPVEVQVMLRVKKLEISSHNDSIVNKSIEFTALFYEGSDLTFTWSFGDGSDDYVTENPDEIVRHTYTRVGVFYVALTASNLISSAKYRLQLFVLDKVCKPPKIVIHGNEIKKINRSDPLFIEAELKAMVCDLTKAVTYQWTIYNSTDMKSIAFDDLEPNTFKRKILYLPPLSMLYGNYTFQVKVRAKHTIIYVTSQFDMEVVATPLFVGIKGGISRDIESHGNVVLDGSNSVDVDFNSNSDLNFNWSCSTSFVVLEMNCFKEGYADLVNNSTPVMSFPASWLRGDESEFLFILTVSAENHQPINASQVINIMDSSSGTLRASVYCPQCERGIVNANERLSIQTVCPDCPAEGTEYSWTIYLVSDEPDVPVHRMSPCLLSDTSSSYELLQSANDSGSNVKMKKTESVRQETETTAKESSTESKSSSVSSGTMKDASLRPRSLDASASLATNSTAAELPIPGRVVPKSQRPITTSDLSVSENLDSPSSRKKYKSTSGTDMMSEGMPGESGSSAGGRYPGLTPEEEDGGKRRPGANTESGSGASDRKNEVFDQQKEPIIKDYIDHITAKGKTLTLLSDSQTVTGFKKRSLVLKPNTLKQGRTYLNTVHVMSADGRSSEASTAFVVNKSPIKGDCEISADEGVEMVTVFRVYCREWQDQHTPLQYEVSYNYETGGMKYLIYRGLQRDIRFTMPAGAAENGYKVNLFISVLDSIGAKTSICYRQVTVKPSVTSEYPVSSTNRITQEHLIYKDLVEDNGVYASAIDQGDDRMAKVLIRYLATKLNKLTTSVADDRLTDLRTLIRTDLLQKLLDLPVRNELEVLQTIQALVSITAVNQELNEAGIDLAVKVYRMVLKGSHQLYKASKTPNRDLLTLAVEVGSHIIEATSESAKLADKDIWFYNRSLVLGMDTLEDLIKNDVSFHAIDEGFVKSDVNYLATIAGRFDLHDTPEFVINQTKATLPANMGIILDSPGLEGSSLDEFSPYRDCYQAQLTRYRRNPYTFAEQHRDMIKSEVCSLKIYSCDGQQKEVSGLHDKNMVHLEVPRLPEEDEAIITYQLLKSQMSVHQFNMSLTDLQQFVNIHIQFSPISGGHLFPISVLIAYKKPPSPWEYILKKEYEASVNELQIFLPAGFFNVSGEYFLGIVDASYNAGRPKPGQITARNYTLKLWWTKCMYWNQSETQWSDSGCWATEKSTYYVTHCRCNHLSVFGCSFNVPNTVLQLIEVEDFFDPNENLVCITLVGMFLCAYAALLFLCHKADVHDARKGDISYLQDNSLTDKQKYEVTIETGFRRGAGTTAKISIILHGEEGMSETRELISDDERPLFERNSRDKFILTLPNSIGKIWKIQIWHNNFGSSPSWYLSRVIVKDLNNGNVYYFISEKWLAVEEDDGKVEREFLALEGNLGFKKVLWAKGTQYMADYHLWTSLFTRPSYSQFTRKQRLTCCLTIMLIYMCLNVLVHQRIQKEYRGEFGLLDLSWRNVVIGTLCCVCVFPIHLLITVLFRRSKKQVSDIGETFTDDFKDDLHYTSGKPNERSVPEEEDDEPVQPVMTYSLLDQSILNWPRIQDWAQKQWIKRQHNSISAAEEPEIVTNETSATQILYKRVIGSEIDQASSGFEDSNSTDPRPQMTISSQASSMRNKTQSVSSTGSQKSSVFTAKSSHTRLFLPHWFEYVAWSLCIIISLGCSALTVWYGFRFGKTKSIMWLQSLYVTVIVCVFVMQPLVILLTVLYTALRYRKDPKILDHKDDRYFGEKANLEIMKRKKEKSREIYNENEEVDQAVAARQRSRYLRFARPPQEKQLIEARKKIMKEKKAVSLIRNTLVVIVMFFLICIIAYGKDTNSPFYLNEAVKNIFVRSGKPSFNEIKNASCWYNWTQEHLINVLYRNDFAGNITSNLREFPILHGTSYVIGEVNIRQMRVTKEKCSNSIPHLPTICRYGYSSTNKVSSTFGQSTQYTQGYSSFPVHGQHGVYDSSGYVMKLNNSGYEALSQVRNLALEGFIDQQSRALIIEFTLFNAPTKLFTSVLLLLEFPPTGGATSDHRVTSTYLFRYITVLDNFVLFCELFFILLIVWKLKILVCDIIKMRKNIFQHGWKIYEMIVSFVSIAYVTCFAYRFLLVSETVDTLQSTYYEQFVDVSYIAVWDEILRSEVGLLLFLILIKSLRLLKYNKSFTLFEKVYRRVHRELILLFGLMLGLLVAFTSMGHVLFGAISYGFRDLWSGFFTVSILLTGRPWDIDEESSVAYSTRIFLLSFTVFVTGLLTAYVISFLSFRFKFYKRKRSKILVMSARGTITFYWQRLLLYTGLRIEEIEVEPDNTLPPEFTMAEIEYQVDELFFRISALSGSHSLPEKITAYYTDSDGTYGVGDDGISSGGSEIHPADDHEERLEHRVQKIEDNLCSQEPYLAQLLNLDSIGTDFLSQEREKQLRSHLEMEIFRQLQIQRQDPETGQSSGCEFKDGTSGSSTEMSTPSSGTNRKQQGQTNFNNAMPGTSSSPNPQFEKDSIIKSLVCDNNAIASNIHQEQTSNLNPDIIEELLKNQTKVRSLDSQGRANPEQTGSDPDKSHFLKNPKFCDNSKQLKKPDLPSKPNFINPGIREVTSHEVTKPKLLNSPALRQLRSSFNASERSSLRGESNSGSSITTESSSGSEQDAIHGMHRSMGKRNLRKTKSRGKGKGPVNLSSALLDELDTETRDDIDFTDSAFYKFPQIQDEHDSIPEQSLEK